MGNDPSHWGDAEFEDFVARELEGLADRARSKGICFDCLSDRLIFEVVAGLAQSGVSDEEILGVVQDALDDAVESDEAEPLAKGPSHRLH